MMTGDVLDPLPGATAQEREFLRSLRGEFSDADQRDFALRLASDPALAERYARWAKAWNGIADPAERPGMALPGDFAARVTARTAGPSGDWQRAPAWMRSAAAAALVVGVACGIGWGRQLDGPREDPTALAGLESVAGETSFEESEISLWEALATGDEDPVGGES
jgi:anti-sigma factor RsiW